MRSVKMPAWAGVFAWALLSAAGPARALDVKVTPNTARLTPYQVFELTFSTAGDTRGRRGT